MNLSKTGKLIAKLRHEKGFTQKDIAKLLNISPKTISKWETGNGFPDVSILAELSEIFSVDISKLLEGEIPTAKPESLNMKKLKFYVCENCGNIISDMANAEIVCCGRKLSSLSAKTPDEAHKPSIEKIEDDFYITFPHPMEKGHYISFISYVRFDRVLTLKLYPEQGPEVRFPQMRGGKMYWYCTNHGLFELKI